MGFHVEIESRHGGSFRGYEARAVGTSSAPSVLILHEWFGLNDSMRMQAERFAALGFHALAVDLYDGKVAGDAGSARRLATEMRLQHAMKVIAVATEYVRNQSRTNGKIGMAGFCLGGAVAVAAASVVEGLSATVTFCGLPPTRYTDVSRVTAPVMGHYGMRDPLLPIAQPKAVFESMSAVGTRASFYAYEAGHAFMRSSSQSYHASVAELAWQRTLNLFEQELQ